MNIRGALREARKRWGERAIVRDSQHPSTSEFRQNARDAYDLLKMGPVEPGTDKAVRKSELATLRGQMMNYRFAVGERMPYLGAFHVIGQGDTWEEAFRMADSRQHS